MAARQVKRQRVTTRHRSQGLTLEVTGLDRRGLEALRLELTRLGVMRGFQLTEFRVIESQRSL